MFAEPVFQHRDFLDTMNCMEDNPYQSPESAPEVEKRPQKPPTNRYERAGLAGLLTFLGVMVLLVPVFSSIASFSDRKIQIHTYWWLMAIIACPFGVGMAWWTWRSPESKLPAIVVLLLVSFILLGFLALVIYGLLADAGLL